MKKFFCLIAFSVIALGCNRGYKPPISDEARFELAKPIDCTSAQEDIRALEKEKLDVSEQAKAGIKMFVPAAAARTILHGDYVDRGAVAIGEYNQAIDDKIKEIKEKCLK